MGKVLRYLIAVTVCGLTVLASADEKQSRLSLSNQHQSIGVQVKVERFTAAAAISIKAAGFRFVRFGVWVNAMQSAQYRQQVVNAFATARAAGLPVLLTVRSTVPLMQASAAQTAYDAKLRDAAGQLVRVVNALVSTDGSNILAIELWNEPEQPTYWPTGDVDSTFPIYMKAVCTGLKASHVSVPVAGFGFATVPAAGAESDKLLQSIDVKSAHCIDAVSYHAYGMSVQQIQQASRYIRSHYGLPALITEWGVSSGSKDGLDGQAAKTWSFLMQRDSMKTLLISIYEWQDTGNGKNARERNFGLVDAAGEPKPVLGAVSAALRQR